MGMKDIWSSKQLVAAAQQLHESRLYERFSDHDYFLVRTPKLDEPAVVVFMGYGGEAFGLNVFLGPSALASYRALFDAGSEARAHREMLRSSVIGYQMSDVMDLTHDARRWLKKAKIRPCGDQLYPDPMSIKPGKAPSAVLKDSEVRLLLHLVRGILAAAQDKSFKPCGTDRYGRVLCIQLDEDTEHPKAVPAWEHYAPDNRAGRSVDADADKPMVSRFDLGGLKANGDNWLVSLLPIPGAIQGDDRQPYMLIVCSEQSQNFYPNLLMGIEPADLVDALARLMRGEPEPFCGQSAAGLPLDITPPPTGLPARLVFDSMSLCDMLCGTFEPLGVQCIDGSDDPGLQRMLDDLHELYEAFMLIDEDALFLQDDRIPDADDLDGWKQVDGRLKDMILDELNRNRGYLRSRALKRYFGPGADPQKLFSAYHKFMIMGSYAHWFTTSYRSARNRPSLAEQWLDDPHVSEAVKTLLRAILSQGPSIYRIDEADENTGKIVFADLFSDDVTIVTDFALSICIEPGCFVPARLVPVGNFHFVYPVGPVMVGCQWSRAMAFFDDQRITPEPVLFRDQPHLLGRLWAVLDEYAVDLQNADGHTFVPQTAVFACPNRPALERFFAEQPDYESEGDDPNAWVWFRPGTEISTDKVVKGTHMINTHFDTSTGPATLLGHIELHDGRFTLTTNSRERFDTARAALEQVKGVRLISVEAEPITPSRQEPTTATPMHREDDPIVADKAMLDTARDFLTNHYRQWLDLPIPALRGKTPRQAAKDPKLRRQLAAMIRAIPDPTNLGDNNIRINAPRQMLLAELGLD